MKKPAKINERRKEIIKSAYVLSWTGTRMVFYHAVFVYC